MRNSTVTNTRVNNSKKVRKRPTGGPGPPWAPGPGDFAPPAPPLWTALDVLHADGVPRTYPRRHAVVITGP
ncbi:unnamed protein product [Nesidiocoris tenuis]|uniref:Uncharacterized protein n=1 Tax=Nesidiocoris tenuis TaxID=355587 RepID=A0A6H5H098_9HEMI|nr:unnamed protein product [Nesidiocoris tenuis]